jgi:hypothetical protein
MDRLFAGSFDRNLLAILQARQIAATATSEEIL